MFCFKVPGRMFVVFLAEIYETAYPPWRATKTILDYKNPDRPQNCCWVCDSTFGLARSQMEGLQNGLGLSEVHPIEINTG